MEHYLKVDEPITYGVSPDASFPVIFAEKTINNILIEGTSTQKGTILLKDFDAGIVINAVPDKCVFRLGFTCLKCKEYALYELKENFTENNINFEVKDDNGDLVYTVYGKAAHGSIPHVGINAASYAINALKEVLNNDFVNFYSEVIGLDIHGEKLGCYAIDEYGPIAVNVGLVSYKDDKFTIKINSRLPFNTSTEKMVEQINQTIAKYDFAKLTLLSSADGFIVDNVKVQGSIGIVPAGTIFPIRLESVVGSKISNVTDVYTAKTPKNYVTKDKYLLISENSDMKGQVKYVQRGRLFKNQGEVIIKNELLVTPNDQAVMVYGVATLTPDKIGFWRKIFKGANVQTSPGDIVNIRLLAPIKIDLTNGYIYE